jgi:hypothetical protein
MKKRAPKNRSRPKPAPAFVFSLFPAHLAFLLFDHALEDVPHTKQKL